MVRGIATVVAVVLGVAAAPALGATTRFVTPTGTGDCSAASPCDIVTGINGAGNGDTVNIAAGAYGSVASPLTTNLADNGHTLTIQGAPGSQSIITTSSLVGGGLGLSGPDTHVSDLRIEHVGAGNGVTLGSTDAAHPVVATRLWVDGDATSFDPCILNQAAATLTDSLCVQHRAATGVLSLNDAVDAIVRNVTVIGLGSGDNALNIDPGNNGLTATVVNSILSSPGDNIAVRDTLYGVNLHLAHDAYSTLHEDAAKSTIAATGTLDTAADPPSLTGDPAYDEKAGSPTIDAGVDDPANGATDLAGRPRMLGTLTDIGAYEFPVTPVVSPLAASSVTQTSAVLNALVNPEGGATTTAFTFGGATLSTAALPGDGTAHVVSTTVTGLTPGTTYSYTASATNVAGSASTPAVTFTTLAPPPPPKPPPPTPTTCSPKTKLKLTLKLSHHDKLRFARIKLNGKTVKKKTRSRKITLDLRKIGSATATVTVTVTTSKGRHRHATRRYTLCDPRRIAGKATFTI